MDQVLLTIRARSNSFMQALQSVTWTCRGGSHSLVHALASCFAYHGGKMPETEEEGAQVMAEWMAWFENLGAAVVDGGNPLGPSSTVNSDGSVTCDGGSNPLSGYSLINADSIEQATDLAKGCPILKAEGSVEIAEAMDM